MSGSTPANLCVWSVKAQTLLPLAKQEQNLGGFQEYTNRTVRTFLRHLESLRSLEKESTRRGDQSLYMFNGV